MRKRLEPPISRFKPSLFTNIISNVFILNCVYKFTSATRELTSSYVLGDSPYPGYKGKQVPGLVESGFRMSKPKHVSDNV